MSDATPAMYAGLDQMIARATTVDKKERPQNKPERETTDDAEKAHAVPSEPKPLALYRKQTFYLGADELRFIEHAQETMQAQYKHEVFKNDLVRAALELLAKDFAINKDKSFLVRKFVRR
jgi:hypothetical protein